MTQVSSSMRQIENLFGRRVVFKDKASYLRKVNLLKLGGASKLNVVSDFDFTLTRFMMDGSRGASCHKTIEDCGLLSDDYHQKAQAVQLKYYPLEVDPTLDVQTRTDYMIEWVEVAHELLVQSGLTKANVELAVKLTLERKKIALRDKVLEFFEKLKAEKIPLLVFSAGITDVLEEVLRQSGETLDHDLVHIISNRCIFNGPEQQLSGFEEPTLHVFNKKAEAFLDTDYFQIKDLSNRTNLILIGDSLGDVSMSEGMNYDPASLLKIGFLSDRLERMEQYLESYDVVILDDPDFEVPLSILKNICDEQDETIEAADGGGRQ